MAAPFGSLFWPRSIPTTGGLPWGGANPNPQADLLSVVQDVCDEVSSPKVCVRVRVCACACVYVQARVCERHGPRNTGMSPHCSEGGHAGQMAIM